MAYIKTEKVAEIRSALKARFPKFKFSVRRDSGQHGLTVSILSGPIRFSERDHCQLNHYRTGEYKNSHILKEIVAIAMDGNWDRSRIEEDYFDVGWYLHLEQGKWDRPYRQN